MYKGLLSLKPSPAIFCLRYLLWFVIGIGMALPSKLCEGLIDSPKEEQSPISAVWVE